MYMLRCIRLLWLIPRSWIDSRLIRKKSFSERYGRMAHWSTKVMSSLKVELKVDQQEALPKDRPILFVSNHQSEFDMLMLIKGIHIPFSFISKVENEKVPYVASWSKTLDVIFFDREDRSSGIHMLREAARRLKDQKNLLIFPEGTRSKGTKMHEMQAGSLQPAFMAKAYIVPVVLKNSYDYKNLVKHKMPCRMTIMKAIPFEEYKPLKAEGLVKVLQEQMQNELEKQ